MVRTICEYIWFVNSVCWSRNDLGGTFCSSQSLAFYKQNQDITDILDNMDVYVLPVMNPDGYLYTWTTVKVHPAAVDNH